MGVIKNYERPTPVSQYKADVDALIDAGEGAAFELIAPTKAEGKRGSATTERLKFQNAARGAGYTARVTEEEELPDNTTRLVFILTDKRTRSPKTENADDAPQASETKPATK